LLPKIADIFFGQMAKLSVTDKENEDLFKKIASAQKKVEYTEARDIVFDLVEFDLKPFLNKTNKKICIIWPDKDELLGVKGAKYLEKNLKKSEVLIEYGAGHCLATINPKILADQIASFVTPGSK
jgi:pimeloyl-ACP methyl ester carboxylesterase